MRLLQRFTILCQSSILYVPPRMTNFGHPMEPVSVILGRSCESASPFRCQQASYDRLTPGTSQIHGNLSGNKDVLPGQAVGRRFCWGGMRLSRDGALFGT